MDKNPPKRSPVLLLTYNRPDEFMRTIASLASCDHSDEYELYINIDAPNIFKDGDVQKQKEIKASIIEHEGRFKKLILREHRYHKGLANSVIESVSELIDQYGSIIVIEDDFILSHDCLDFLNDALTYYERHSRVWSVTAYTPPLNALKTYDKDIYMTYRPCSWIWGTWADRWNKINWDICDYDDFRKNAEKQRLFTRGGYDMPAMLCMQMSGLIDSWAIRWGYAACKENMMTVYPKENRVWHIGWNGTHVKREFPQMELRKKYSPYTFCDDIDQKLWKEYQYSCGSSFQEFKGWFLYQKYREPYKFESMFNIMCEWRKISEKGQNTVDYFKNRGYRRIAIYGRGRIGEFLRSELDGTEVSFAFFIDKDKQNQEEGVCFDPADELPTCDCLVISVVTDTRMIVDYAKNKGMTKNIKTIVEVLRDQ